MIETLEKTDEIKTIKFQKDTWVLEVPAEVCQKEGFAEGTLVSLTFKDGGIQTSYIHQTETAKKSAERFVGKYGEFMKEMELVDG